MTAGRPEAVGGELQRLRDEVERLGKEHAVLAEREHRRPRAIAFQLGAAWMVAAGALLPGTSPIYGDARFADLALIWGLASITTLAAPLAYRWRAHVPGAYRVLEYLEGVCMTAAMLITIYVSGTLLSPLWVSMPFAAVWWATTKPLEPVRWGLMVLGNVTWFTALCLYTWGTQAAATGGAIGLSLVVVFIGTGWRSRRALRDEAERNLAREDVSKAYMSAERERIHAELQRDVGAGIADITQRMASLAGELDDKQLRVLLDLARGAHAEVEGLALSARNDAPDLERILQQKCGALCSGGRYQQAIDAAFDTRPLDAEQARTIIRVAQELVRNAVTHGRARDVRLELTRDEVVRLRVSDDGAGLSAELFHSGTGGLRNARQWLAQHDGALHLATAPDARGTVICAELITDKR